MKKSNIMLVIAFVITLGWTVFISLLAVSAINDIRSGKVPDYVICSDQVNNSAKNPSSTVH